MTGVKVNHGIRIEPEPGPKYHRHRRFRWVCACGARGMWAFGQYAVKHVTWLGQRHVDRGIERDGPPPAGHPAAGWRATGPPPRNVVGSSD